MVLGLSAEALIKIWDPVDVVPGLTALINELNALGHKCVLGTNQSRFRADSMEKRLVTESCFLMAIIHVDSG